MIVTEIQSCLEAIESNSSLYDAKNFEKRIEVIDFLEFHFDDAIEQLTFLKHRAEKVKSGLEDINTTLFQRLQKEIRMGGLMGDKFKTLVMKYVDFNLDDEVNGEPGYDNLDTFVNGLCLSGNTPGHTKDLEPEMVDYHKTPARIVFELVEKSNFNKEDVFFDVGSGLGQVAILVNLLAGITTKGIEFEPAFCDYARACAADLNLSNVTFINADARKADYSDGSVFFLFTPFKGEILKEVLDMLRKESLLRKIKIITYGPCIAQVVLENWLDFADPHDKSTWNLCVFTSR